MDLIDLYKTRGINSIPLYKWDEILNNYSNESNNKSSNDTFKKNNIYIKNAGPGVIILSNNDTIGCVKKYYDLRNKTDNTTIKKQLSNQCYLIKQYLGIPITNTKDCVQCHKMCLNKRNDGDLKNIY